MKTRANVKISASESMEIDVFQRLAPRVLLKRTGDLSTFTHTTFLPSLPTKDYWDDQHHQEGLKIELANDIAKINQ